MSKAIVMVVEDDGLAEEVAGFMGAVMTLNGWKHNGPSIIDWPVQSDKLKGYRGVDPLQPEEPWSR